SGANVCGARGIQGGTSHRGIEGVQEDSIGAREKNDGEDDIEGERSGVLERGQGCVGSGNRPGPSADWEFFGGYQTKDYGEGEALAWQGQTLYFAGLRRDIVRTECDIIQPQMSRSPAYTSPPGGNYEQQTKVDRHCYRCVNFDFSCPALSDSR